MNCNFIFVFFAALFITQNAASTLEALHLKEGTLKQSIESLTGFKEELTAKGDEKFVTFLDEEKDMVARIMEKCLQKIDKKLEDDNKAGGNAQNCKATAQAELQKAESMVTPQLEKCVQDNKPDWNTLMAETSAIITKGETFRAEVQAIENNCIADPANQEKCIGLKLPEVGSGLGLFYEAVGQLKWKAGKTVGIAFRNASACSNTPLRILTMQHNIAMNKALSCIETTQ